MFFDKLNIGDDFILAKPELKSLRLMKIADCEDIELRNEMGCRNIRNIVELNGMTPGKIAYCYPDTDVIKIEKNVAQLR